jgi:hypothetical protein
VAEDNVDAMFHAKRDTSDLTPMGMFDGFNEKIDAEIVTGEIAAAKGNYEATGAITLPSGTSDTDAIDKVVAFVRAGHAKLKKMLSCSSTRKPCISPSRPWRTKPSTTHW